MCVCVCVCVCVSMRPYPSLTGQGRGGVWVVWIGSGLVSAAERVLSEVTPSLIPPLQSKLWFTSRTLDSFILWQSGILPILSASIIFNHIPPAHCRPGIATLQAHRHARDAHAATHTHTQRHILIYPNTHRAKVLQTVKMDSDHLTNQQLFERAIYKSRKLTCVLVEVL